MAIDALQIGAGRIGKGLNGAVLSEAGAHITFADVVQEQVDLINKIGEYPVVTVSAEGEQHQMVRGVDAVNIADEEAFLSRFVNADMVVTAVGSNMLPAIAPQMAKGLLERYKQRPKDQLHTIVIACENITDNTLLLKQYIMANLPEEYRDPIDEAVSFPNCVVDRIVPTASGAAENDNPLAVTVEKYYQWVVNGNQLKGPMPVIPGIAVSYDLDAILEQKLITLNGPHALIAYFGARAGYQYIHEAVQDDNIMGLVQGALQEIEVVVVNRNPTISVADQRAYASKNIERFKNPYLRDETTRVARDPIRKLGHNDRLVKPALLALDMGERPDNLVTGIAGALLYENPHDQQAQQLHNALQTKGIDVVMADVSQLEPENPIARQVKATYLFDLLRQ